MTNTTLEGKSLKHFHIEKLIGRGGMGVVYLGRDTRLDRPVAIKVLRPDLTANRDRQSRFLQEGKQLASHIHPYQRSEKRTVIYPSISEI